MRQFVLLRKTVRDQRGGAIGVALAAFLIALMDVLIYPEYRESLKDFQMPDFFKGFLGEAASITTPEGFISAEFFSWVPLLLITLAVIGATGTLAGEEAAGTLDMLLAQPVSRRRVVLEKAAGLCLVVAACAAASIPGFLIGMVFVDFDLALTRLIAAVVNMLPVTFLYLGLGLWCGAALPSRGAAAATAIGAVVAAYFLFTIGSAVSSLQTAAKCSPFYWSDAAHVLIHGFDWLRAGALTAIAASFFGFAVVAFERRDIAAGGTATRMRERLARFVHRAPRPGGNEGQSRDRAGTV